MKRLFLLTMVAILGIVACSKDQALTNAPVPTEEQGGSQTEAPALPSAVPTYSYKFNDISLDGTWKTPCMNKDVQQIYKPYVGEIVIKNGAFYQKWTWFSDQECKVVTDKPAYSAAFLYVIGSDTSTNVKEFDYEWDVTRNGVRYVGKQFNIITVSGDKLKFHPIYAEATDEFDGSTAEKRFKSFLNKNLGYEEEYTRQ